MKILHKLSTLCLLASVFFLPLHLNLNNIFLVSFIGLSLVQFIIESKTEKIKQIKKHKWSLVIVSIPFLLNLLGLAFTDEPSLGWQYTVRAFPFLFLPLIGVVHPESIKNNYKTMGYVLVLGCLYVTIFSWSVSIYEILSLNKPLTSLYGPLYSHHNLVKHLDLHAAYLSVCIYTAIGFLVLIYKKFVKRDKAIAVIIIIVLTLFMFHLLSRNAIIYYLLSSFVFLVFYRQWKVLLLGFVSIVILGVLAYNVKHNYLRDRIFKNLNVFEKETQFSKKDDRFDRLSASYKVFKQSPIIGYGTAGESKYRNEEFKKNKDWVAYNEQYNAHNQFFEYLSTYGIIGGLAYIIFFCYLLVDVFKNRRVFFIYIFTGMFLACITESMFERSQGVVYMAISIMIWLSFKIKTNKTIT